LTVIRPARALLWLTAALALAGCNSSAYRPITATVGVDTGVTLTTAGSATALLTAQTLALGASVQHPSNADGVSWSLTGTGSLTAITTTSATFVAPATITGAATALITVTSIANPTQYASVALIVLGTPQINPLTLFPGNVNVAYQAPVAAAGGDAPFTWVVLSGALPPGLALNGSTSSATYIEGTPTTAGTYTFTLQTTDTLSNVASVALSMVINPQAACVLSGRYSLLFSGFRGGGPATHTGAISISSTGVITGEQDYKDPHRTTPAETLLATSNCVNRETNTGVLTLNAPSGQLVYNFAATPPDAAGVIHSARLQLISSGSDSGSGQLELQDPTAITAAPPAGDFAFGLLGVNATGVHYGTAGRFTSSTAGALSAGLVDSNAPSALTDAPLSGTLSAPDANGRGTLTLLAGSQTSTLAYYLVNASKMFLIDVDATTGNGTERMAGQMTAQTGDVAGGGFDASALATPSILSLFGASGTVEPIAVMALGRLSNDNATAGTVDVLLDTSDQDILSSDVVYASQSYAVETNGRGTLSLASTAGARSFSFYLDATSNGYIVEQGSAAGTGGFLEAQFQGPYPSPPPSGIFPPTLPNGFVGGTAYPQAQGPITLDALCSLNYDALSSNFLNGSFAIDPTTGRGLGTVTESGVGTDSASLYIVSPTKFDLLRYGTRAIDGMIEYMIQD